MAYKFDGDVVSQEFEKAFGRSVDTLTREELWWLTKFAKFVRQRARNNAAFNNYMNRNFPHATFRQVPKENPDGSTYEGLEISIPEENE